MVHPRLVLHGPRDIGTEPTKRRFDTLVPLLPRVGRLKVYHITIVTDREGTASMHEIPDGSSDASTPDPGIAEIE